MSKLSIGQTVYWLEHIYVGRYIVQPASVISYDDDKVCLHEWDRITFRPRSDVFTSREEAEAQAKIKLE